MSIFFFSFNFFLVEPKKKAYLQQALDALPGRHNSSSKHPSQAPSVEQLDSIKFLLGRFLLQALAHAETEKAHREHGGDAHERGGHTYEVFKAISKQYYFHFQRNFKTSLF